MKQIDPAFALRRADKAIAVLQQGNVVAHVAAADALDWPTALAQGIENAVAASPAASAAAPMDLTAALVNAMVSPFGDRARYIPPAEMRPAPPLKTGTAFGATWERQGDRLLIRTVDPEASAARVKIEPGDAILEIDDLPVASLPDAMVADLLSQPIARRLTMQLARANPKLGSRVVLYGGTRMFEVSASDGVIVIRFQSFGREVNAVMAAYREAARAVPPPGPVGIVLDLRGNAGGTLDAAIDLASQFLEPGPLVMVAGSKMSSAERYRVRHGMGTAHGQLMTLPLVVVVNGQTASGAEIVAGALQLRQRAVVVGTATYAMGEIDTIIPIVRLGAVRFTTGRVFLPGIYPLHEIGIAPTVCLAGAAGSDVERALAGGLRTMAPYANRPRIRLTLEERAKARGACPTSPREPPFDLAVAEHLARTPAAYRAALDLVPANPLTPAGD